MESMKEKMKLYGYSMLTEDELMLPGDKEKLMPRLVANQKASNDAKQDYEKMKLA